MWIFQGRINRKKQGILKGEKVVKEKKHPAVSFPAVRSSGSGIYRKYSGYGKYTKASQYSGVVGAFVS